MWGDDNNADRETGKKAEVEATDHLRQRGWTVTPYPMGQTGFDMLVEGEEAKPRLCEVRAKYPDHKNRYGLEAWKVSLWVAADVVYIVKDTRREEWFAVSMRKLPPPEDGLPGSYKAGTFDRELPNAYWSVDHWHRLEWSYG